MRPARAEVGRELAARASARAASRGRRGGSRRARGARRCSPARRRGRPAGRARASCSATASASSPRAVAQRRRRARRSGRRRARRSAGGRRPGGCMSIRSIARRGEVGERAGSSGASAPARVKTVRLWTASECSSSSATGSAPRQLAELRRSPAGVGALGDVRDGEQAVSAVGVPIRAAAPRRGRSRCRRPQTVGLHHDAVEVDRHLDPAADRRRGAEGDVDGAEQLLVLEHVAGQLRLLVRADRRARRSSSPPRRAAVSSSSSAAPSAPARLGQPPAGRRSSVTGSAGIPTPAIVPSTTSVPSQARSSGEMKPSPQGRLPKAAGAVSSPASGIAVRPSRPEPQVAAVGAGDPRLAAGVERSRRSRCRGGAARPCRRSSPGRASPR